MPGGLRVDLHGSGFLYNMVRHMVGALLSVGFGNLDPQQITGILAVGEGAPPGSMLAMLWLSKLLSMASLTAV